MNLLFLKFYYHTCGRLHNSSLGFLRKSRWLTYLRFFVKNPILLRKSIIYRFTWVIQSAIKGDITTLMLKAVRIIDIVQAQNQILYLAREC